MPFNQSGGLAPGLSGYTTTYLENLLVTNPNAQTFPLSIVGGIPAGAPGLFPPNPPYWNEYGDAIYWTDVTRQQVLNELANRAAQEKQSGLASNNQIVNGGNQAVGAVAPSSVAIGLPNAVPPATEINVASPVTAPLGQAN